MKKMTVILSLLLASSSVFASTYSSPAVVRFNNYTKEDCASENGTYEESEEACYYDAENTIAIEKNQQAKTTVKISVIYGPANMRDFSGVVTKTQNSTLTVKEADIGDDGVVGDLVKGGCSLVVKLVKNQAILTLGKTCDGNLARASGAVKK